MIAIRPFLAGDQESVIALVRSVLAEFGFSAQIEALARDLAEAEQRYAGPRAGIWVAESDGAVVGTVAIRPKEAATCEIKRLYLHPDARGAGTGQALYAHAEAFARAAGYETIWLDSSRRFVKARRLYERNGFVLLESIDNDWEDNVYAKTLV